MSRLRCSKLYLSRKGTEKLFSLHLNSNSTKFITNRRRETTGWWVHDERNYLTGVPDEEAELINKYSQKSQTSISLQTLTKSGERLHKVGNNHQSNNQSNATDQIVIQAANFIQREMPIRLAKRIRDLNNVPLMKDMPSVQAVKDIYINSFLTLVNWRHIGVEEAKVIDSPRSEAIFARTLELLYKRHSGVLIQMARGAFELRSSLRRDIRNDNTCGDESLSSSFENIDDCHAFLDRFYMSRIGIRILAGQYLALRRRPPPGYVGLICKDCSPYAVLQHAITEASYICRRNYGGQAPEVIVDGRVDLTLEYIPTNLHYILLELLKNSMRATVEHHVSNGCSWPPVRVIISDGHMNEDVVIKVADEGGGIPRSNMKKIWSYLFTTADPAVQEGMVAFNENDDHSIESPLAGLGYGLPISRSYARYFGGDLSIMSIEGFGTDAYVHLRRLGDSQEPLPM